MIERLLNFHFFLDENMPVTMLGEYLLHVDFEYGPLSSIQSTHVKSSLAPLNKVAGRSSLDPLFKL